MRLYLTYHGRSRDALNAVLMCKWHRLWFCLKISGEILRGGILKINSYCRKWVDATIDFQELKIDENHKTLPKFEYQETDVIFTKRKPS